jgi:hypothetical protein
MSVLARKEKHMKKFIYPATVVLLLGMVATADVLDQDTITISKSVLKDKIKGAWAAQTIGVTFGSPIEFKYNSTMVQDYQKIVWYDGYLKDTYDNEP